MGTKEEYLGLLHNSYKNIKKMDPNAVVVSSSMAIAHGIPNVNKISNFLKYVLENQEDYTDLIDVHLYSCADENVPLRLQLIKNEITKSGYSKPIWSTETGEVDIDCPDNPDFIDSFDSPEELKLQSEELVKRHAMVFAEGVERIFRLRIFNYVVGEPSDSTWNHMSLIYEGKKKPAFYTYQIMTSKLNDFSSAEKLGIGDNVYRFMVVGKSVIIAWDDGGSKLDLSSYVSGNVKVTHIITNAGETQPRIETVSSNAIQLTETPVFIEAI